MFGWKQYRFHKKHARTRYAKIMFLHPVGSVGHVVHSGAFGLQNIDTLFVMLGWDRYRFNKNASGHVMPYLCFLIRWNLWVT
jgi:hypothetical protein